MATKNLETLRIKDTYERVVQRVDGAYYDGTGSLLDIASSTDIPSTSSLLTTASATDNTLTFTKGDGSQFDVVIETGSLAGYATEAYVLQQTASLSASLATDIATNSASIASNDIDIANLTLATLTNAGNITTNTNNITTNTANILANDSDIADLFTSASNALTTASVSLNTITFTKGDGSTFPITVDTGSGGVVPGEVVDSLNDLSGSLTLASGDSDLLAITDNGTDTITLTPALPPRVVAQVKNISGGTLVKGTPVHATASASPPSGFLSEVVAADASDPLLMPCHYILNTDLDDGEEGEAILVGKIQGVDTQTPGFSEGDTLYVAAGGGYTNVKPTGTNLIQNLGVVTKVDNTNGGGEVYGAGRSNDVPNIPAGYTWVGNSDQVATAVPTSSITSNFVITASNVAGDDTIEFLKGGGGTFQVQVNNVANATDAANASAVNIANGSTDTYFLIGAIGNGDDQQLYRNSGVIYNGTSQTVEFPNIQSNGKYFIEGPSNTHEIRTNTADDGFLVYFANWDITNGNLTLTNGEAIFDGNTTITGSLTVSGAIDFDGPSVNINSDSTIGLFGTDVRTGDLSVTSGNDFEIEGGDATITGSLIVSGGNVTYGDDDFTYTPTGGDEAAISITGSLAITGSATGSLTINNAEPVWTTYSSTTVFNNSNTNPQGWNSYSNFDSGLAQYYTKWVAPFKCRVRFVSLFVQGSVTEVTMEAFVNVSNGTNFTTSTPDHTYNLSQTGANQTHHYDWYYDDGETFEVEAGDTIDFALASDGSTNPNSCRLEVTFQKVI